MSHLKRRHGRQNKQNYPGHGGYYGLKCTASLSLIFISLMAVYSHAYAENYFNPRFLSGDPAAVADLSRFEKGLEAPPGTYRVDVYLNNGYMVTRDVVFSTDEKGALVPCLTRGQLASMGASTAKIPGMAALAGDACIPLTRMINGATTQFDVGLQRLNISIPQAFMNNNGRGYIPPEMWDNGIPAAMMNYTFTAGSARGRSTSENYFLNLGTGANLGPWRLRDNTTWSYNSGGGYTRQKNTWTHVNTYLERDIVPWKARLTLGDGYTPSDIFDGLNFRGVQLQSAEEMLPDSLRGFAPVIRGIARGTARVSVKQNGYEIYQTTVPPGPFVINDLFPSGSSGDMQVTVKEADGSNQVFSVPYSSVPVLQRENHVKYAMTVGKYRSGGHQQGTPDFVQGTALWGLSGGWTVYGGTQLSDNYRAFNAGVGKNMGMLGAISADITQANATLPDDSSHQGQSLRFLYNKSLNEWGTNIQLVGYRYSTEGYFTLADTAYNRMSGYTVITQDGPLEIEPKYTDYYNLQYSKRGRLQATVSQSVGRTASLYLSGSQQSYWRTDATDNMLQAGYSGSFSDIAYTLSYSLSKNAWQQGKDQMVAFSLSVPFSHWLPSDSRSVFRRSNVSYSVSDDLNGRTSNQVGVYGSLLDKGNLNYSVMQGYTHGEQGYTGNVGLDYRGARGNLNAGYSRSSGYNQLYYGMNGGVLLHANGITLGQPFSDSAVLVRAPGAEGISVENGTGVRTDGRGYALIPYASDYHDNRVALDVNSLPDNVDLDDTVASVVPTRGAIVRADFKVRVGIKALVNLIYKGKPVPFGAIASSDDGRSTGIVGDNGQVYLTGLPPEGKIKVKWGDTSDTQCQSNFVFENKNVKLPYLTSTCI